MAFELPPLPYAYDALDPYMSAQTLQFHHDKHHQAYVTTLNNLIKDTPLADKSLEEICKASYGDPSKQTIFNNAGQHWNHTLFWQMMKKGGGGAIPGELEAKIKEDLGGIDQFKEAFTQAGLTQFGSGWAWLVVDGGKLKVTKTPNGENPLVHGQTALLGCDVWEHSYYLDYQNRRADYLKAYLDNMVNWEFVAELYSKA
ncbi:superoxide dismutase [Skermanella sp. TT6]|uniref:Superoxide dismutase n=1 Tax=Skermanella cutis TaxID=2775420 RepID=A0ABX7BBM1_9PROT|nr:superoxide dismutase [Skermanella sp. TT6]QQP91587.1 superoxide dismutase [Skermanella sp. TT6]